MIKKLLEAFDDYEFEELKAEVRNMTDENMHSEAVLAIAQKYAPEYIEKFQKFIDLRDKNQGLELEEVNERGRLALDMFKKLKEILGNEKAVELYSCL